MKTEKILDRYNYIIYQIYISTYIYIYIYMCVCVCVCVCVCHYSIKGLLTMSDKPLKNFRSGKSQSIARVNYS